MSQSCHCNGTRGTDCDWCQGTGWITKPFVIKGEKDSLNDEGLSGAIKNLDVSNLARNFSRIFQSLKDDLVESGKLTVEAKFYFRTKLRLLEKSVIDAEKEAGGLQKMYFVKLVLDIEKFSEKFEKEYNLFFLTRNQRARKKKRRK